MTISTSELLEVLQPRFVPDESIVLQVFPEKLLPVYQSPACNHSFTECNDWLYTDNETNLVTLAHTHQEEYMDAKISPTLYANYSESNRSQKAFRVAILTAAVSHPTHLCVKHMIRKRSQYFNHYSSWCQVLRMPLIWLLRGPFSEKINLCWKCRRRRLAKWSNCYIFLTAVSRKRIEEA